MIEEYRSRMDALRALLGDGVDAIAIVPGANMVYFTGLHFHLSERPIIALIHADGFAIIVPQLETLKLTERPDLDAVAFAWGDTEGYMGAFERALNELDLRGKTLGVDGMTMRVSEWLTLQRLDSTLRIKPVERELVRIRSRKTPAELNAMRRAIQISEQALAELTRELKPGMTEKLIAARLEEKMMALGAEGLAFGTLVQSGPNSANPHGMTSSRELRAEEFLIIDFGATYNSYPADITRTFCIGQPSAEMQVIYDTVLRANQAATAAARPGVTMGAVDEAARTVIEAAGYGQYFIHRTGHGLGLDGHEPIPQIASGVEDVLEVGMAFTIEPGIYIPGMGGVRIEDNVVVTENGLEVLTHYPYGMILE